MTRAKLNSRAEIIFSGGGVFVPSPLALNNNKSINEAYQRLLTLYYIKSGAKAVIPGAHTGEFALNNIEILNNWMVWIKEMCIEYAEEFVLLSMIGGEDIIREAELSAKLGYDAVMVAPTSFRGFSEDEVVNLFRNVASIIPAFAFELQRAIPGSYSYSSELWERIFEIVYGAKGASFDTYRSLVMLEAAAKSNQSDSIILLTGNDDRIVSDLSGEYSFRNGDKNNIVNYKGGLLGHFATDTHAAVNWVNAIQQKKINGEWNFDISEVELANGVNRCNMALFDALGSFENSVWGVKYRLASQGLLPGPYCMNENGREGQAKLIDSIYNEYPLLNDKIFISKNLEWMKREVGII